MGLPFTQEELEELRKVLVSGVQSVESDGRKVVYRSLGDQLRILSDAETSAGKPRHRYAKFSKGY